MKRRENGEGTAICYDDKRGLYFQRFSYQSGGYARRKTIYGKTKNELKEKVKAWQAAQMKGIDEKASRITVEEWLDIWLEHYKRPNLEVTTYTSYRQFIRLQIKPYFGKMKLCKVKRINVQQFINKASKDGLKRSSIDILKNVLSSALKQAVNDNLIAVNPVTGVSLPPIKAKHEREPFSRAEISKILSHAAISCADENGSTMPCFYTLLYTLINTGCRIGEALAIEWQQLDFKNNLLVISQNNKYNAIEHKTIIGKTKTINSMRQIPLNASLIKVLKQWKARQAAYKMRLGIDYDDKYNLVFADAVGRIISSSRVRYYWRKVLIETGIKPRGIHHLRHTFATIALAEGVDIKVISEILGHSSVQFTYDIYTHTTTQGKAAAAETVSRFLNSAI